MVIPPQNDCTLEGTAGAEETSCACINQDPQEHLNVRQSLHPQEKSHSS